MDDFDSNSKEIQIRLKNKRIVTTTIFLKQFFNIQRNKPKMQESFSREQFEDEKLSSINVIRTPNSHHGSIHSRIIALMMIR